MVRLNKYLASCGVASRRASDKLIAQGRVTVNGKVVTSVGTQVDEERDEVAVDGRVVQPPQRKVYIMLHKPAGYVTTVRDTRGRPKVVDLVPVSTRLFPVGRLDIDTEGLLLLTNDGEVTNRLLHPRFKVAKTYVAVVDRDVSEQQLAKLRAGVALTDGMTAPCEARLLPDQPPPGRVVELTIREGRKRQVRRMLSAVGLRVLVLRRVAFGPVRLGQLELGQWRYLRPAEIAALRAAALPEPSQEHQELVESQRRP
ncbi:MAG: rRNA pseudouridine synthase [candidate division KSB1 bacterium]|nr:rRNA pseudouridine synthase [candidate division KSB1 bacterium]MDZ7294089.1 rRNA pseudouridine synthase [candidate division KSB1 bacterium]MDZ7378704.1 rRNA pseudouridine synthase [candidate division KSB1 bacterium]